MAKASNVGLEQVFQDVRFGLRLLRREPGFAATTVLTLTLAIGATTAIFSVVDAVLLQPPPFPAPDRLVTLWQTDPNNGNRPAEPAPANFLDWREQATSFEQVAAIEPFSFDFTGDGAPEVFYASLVTEGFFDALGVGAAYGRTFLPDEGVLTLRERIECENEVDEANEHHIQLLESGENPAIALQSAEQTLDLVAALVHLPVVLPRVRPGLERWHDGCESQVQRQLARLVALVGAVHHQGQIGILRSHTGQELSAFRAVVGLARRKRERQCRSSIRGNQMNLGGPSAAGLADGLGAVFFGDYDSTYPRVPAWWTCRHLGKILP